MFVMFDLKPNANRVAQPRHSFLRFLALHEPSPSINPKRHKSAGFTMLELLVVIALLGVVAIAATTFIIDTGELKREEATRTRWDEIRYAIVGNTSRTLNNGPMLSGYVADMGRLPSNLNELLMRGTQQAWSSTELSSVQAGLLGTLSGGWRGPYLYSAGSRFFRDGWDNEDTVSAVNDANNFGWDVALSPVACAPVDCVEMAVQSLGANNNVGGIGFGADFPEDALSAVVVANDWQRPANSISFRVILNKPPAAAQSGLQLRIYFFEDTAITSEESTTFTHDTSISGVTTHTVSIPVAPPIPVLPMGKYAAVIICSAALPEVVYDGDCDATATGMPTYYFNLLPSTSSVDIYWNLP
jgi:prepilin-type N-terminal cleavage/methylation domain-containing protein